MTGQTTELFAANLRDSESLMQDLAKSLAKLEAAQKITQRAAKAHSQWRPSAPSQSDPGTQAMMNSLLTTFLLDGLFGMPMVSSMFQNPMLAGMAEPMHALAQVGMMMGMEDEDEIEPGFYVPSPKAQKAAHFDDVVFAAEKKAYMKAVTAQKNQKRQMVMMKRMVMMLMLQIMQQQNEDEEGGGGEALVPDALREPKLARFKQNRQSVSCIRTLFMRQADIVSVPRVRAPHLRCA